MFLVPYGDAADVRAVISTGRRPIVAALELRCDVVAAPLDFSANVVLGGDEPVQRFACVRDGAVALGQLTLVR